MRWLGVLVLSACSFRMHAVGNDTVVAGDAPRTIDGGPDAPLVDAGPCFGGGLATICLSALPTGNYDVLGMTSVSTDSDCTQVVSQPGGSELCVISGIDIHINDALDATGSRPLVLVATHTLEVNGVIDVSSYRVVNGGSVTAEHIGAGEAPSALCSGAGKGGDDGSAGAGGGAGGSFGGTGGMGATGRNGIGGGPGVPASAVIPSFVRGGCAGTAGGNNSGNGRGRGAHGGGAVYLIANVSITISGTVQAGGEGGFGGDVGAGGGGGGAGGLIGFDAPAVTVTGIVYANGGGGGEGGGANQAGFDGTSSVSATTAEPGGTGNTNGGDGGQGSVGMMHDGGTGQTNNNGGGAGGGGAGVIFVHPDATLGGVVSPS
jgi:hypothetical protein